MRESVEDYGELTTENCKNLIPIGDWGCRLGNALPGLDKAGGIGRNREVIEG